MCYNILETGAPGANAFDGVNLLNGAELMTETGSLRFVVGLKALAAGYDANGNMTLRLKDGARYFLAYDAENRLTSVSGTVRASFAYNGDGQRVSATIGTTITTYIGGYFEWKDGVGTSYYFAGAQRVAMCTVAGVEFLLGDHLGSTSLTVDSLGGNPRELRYFPWGEVRWASGTTPTDYRFTGQMEVASIGLYFYNARWYDSALGRFVQADKLIPHPGNPVSFDRYSYVLNSPIRYSDPSGLIDEDEANVASALVDLIYSQYGVSVETDWGYRKGVWVHGYWTLDEISTVLQALSDMAKAMGGIDIVQSIVNGVIINQAVLGAGTGGQTLENQVTLNSTGFSKWTIVHELAHAWDNSNDGLLSQEMQDTMGARYDHPILHWLFPESKSFWYNPGNGPPACGIDRNLNHQEDFAESMTAFVYPGEALSAATSRGYPYNNPSRGYSYSSYMDTPRGQYIAALIVNIP